MKHVNLSGCLCSDVNYRHTEGKKPFASFQVFDKRIVRCKCFDDIANYARDHLKMGMKVHVSGTEAKEDGGVFVDTLISDKGDAPKVAATLSRASIAEYEAQQLKNGLVPVKAESGYTIWHLKDECVETAKGWKRKIEYLMDVYGAKTVTDVLKQRFTDLKFDAGKIAEYRAWLNRSVDVAKKRDEKQST